MRPVNCLRSYAVFTNYRACSTIIVLTEHSPFDAILFLNDLDKVFRNYENLLPGSVLPITKTFIDGNMVTIYTF